MIPNDKRRRKRPKNRLTGEDRENAILAMSAIVRSRAKGDRDLAQALWVGVLEAAERFDVDARVPFSSYAAWALQGVVAHRAKAMRTGKRTAREVSLDAPVPRRDDCEVMHDVVAAPDLRPSSVERLDAARVVVRLRAHYEGDEIRVRRALKALTADDGEGPSIAAAEGVSRTTPYIWRRHALAIFRH